MPCSVLSLISLPVRFLVLPGMDVLHDKAVPPRALRVEAKSRWRRCVHAAGFFATALLGACSDDVTSTLPGAGYHLQANAGSAPYREGQGLEEEGALGRFAAANPAFGGWFYAGDGDLNVWVLDSGRRGATLRAAVAEEVAKEPRDIMEPASFKIKLRPARFGFVQLSDWRDQISTRFSAIRGMRWTDVDDVRNRVSVGVDSRKTRTQVRRDAASLGIPAGALNVMVISSTAEECSPDMLVCEGNEDPCSINPDDPACTEDPCISDPSLLECNPPEDPASDTAYFLGPQPSVPSTLSGLFPRLMGGIQVEFEHVDYGVVPCTLGFVANSPSHNGPSGRFVVITAAHCSNAVGSMDGNIYGLPTYELDRLFGSEVYDPPLQYFSSASCFFGNGCRNSDANIVSTSLQAPHYASRDYAWGRLARPLGPRTSIRDTTTQVNTAAPEFTISAESRPSVIGSRIHKVGRTTGWTYGSLTYYCRKERGYHCQDPANYLFRTGDSGAPVFRHLRNGTIALVGIHHSRLSVWSYTQSIYSPLSRIRMDLGQLQTFAGGPF